MRNKKILLILLFILILSVALRFWLISDLMVFRLDQEHQVSLAMPIVKDFHIIWIGVSASNLNFYLGPFWVYLTSFWLFISKGNPLITAYVASFIGVVTTLLVFLVGKEIFGKKVGLVASFLYAILPLIVFYDRIYWNVTPVSLLTILLLYSIYKFKDSGLWVVVFAGLYGLVFHTHLSLVFTGFIGFYYFLKERKKIKMKFLVLAAVVFIAVVSPLIAFDYFHKWSNITAPLRVVTLSRGSSFLENTQTHFKYFYEALGRLFFLRDSPIITDETPFDCDLIFASDKRAMSFAPLSSRTKPSPLLSLIPFVVLVLFVFKRTTWIKPERKLLALFILSIIVPFLIFSGGAFEYYLVGFFPLFLYLLSIIFASLPLRLRPFLVALMCGLFIIGVTRVFGADLKYSFYYKRQLIDRVTNLLGKEDFELQEEGYCHNYEGWRYLFSVFGKRPVRSSTDKILGWLYSDEILKVPAKYRVVISEEKIPFNLDISRAVIIDSGGFKAYIFKGF